MAVFVSMAPILAYAESAPPLQPSLEQLEQVYWTLMNTSCQLARAHTPTIPSDYASIFMTRYQNFTGASGEDETPVFEAASKILSLPIVADFLSRSDSFEVGGIDYYCVQCVIINMSTPSGLAGYAVQGQQQTERVKRLLNDAILMRDMLVAGGASENKFGQAMEIYENILNESLILKIPNTRSLSNCSKEHVGNNNTCIHNPWGVLSRFPNITSAKICCGLCKTGCVAWTYFDNTCNAFRYIDGRAKTNEGNCISGGSLPAPKPPAPAPSPHTPPPTPMQPWDDRSPEGILRRLALGTALEFAVPIKHMMVDTEIDPVQRWIELLNLL